MIMSYSTFMLNPIVEREPGRALACPSRGHGMGQDGIGDSF